VARILADFADGHDPACERGWIARAGEDALGSIFCVKGPEPGLAKLRLFFLVPEARGLGLGRRLLDTCMGFAMEAGYRRMTLWTHESHRAACALYAKAGFACVRSDPVRPSAWTWWNRNGRATSEGAENVRFPIRFARAKRSRPARAGRTGRARSSCNRGRWALSRPPVPP
jgi:N-acetylglutamate synthase-like GNAT family acetyltransferase